MALDPLWSSEDNSAIKVNIVQSIRLIPSRTPKVIPFEAFFGRKPNTTQLIILSKPNESNLSHKKIQNNCFRSKTLETNCTTPSCNVEHGARFQTNV